MRIGLLHSTLLLLLSVATASAQLPPVPTPPSAPTNKPKLVVIERLKDLGTIIEGEVPTITWRLENQGDAPLGIARTAASCGCTVVSLTEEQSSIPPGGHVDLEARFDSTGRRGEELKNIIVHSNDPAEPQMKLEFRVTTTPLYEVNPPGLLNLRMIRRGESAASTIDLMPALGRKKVEIESIEVLDDSPVRCSFEPLPSGDALGQRITASVFNDQPLGPLRASAAVRFNVDGIKRTHTIAMRGEVVGDLTWRPLVLDTTRQPSLPGKKLAPVVVESTSAAPFRIVSATAEPYFDVTVESDQVGPPGTLHSIFLVVRNDAPPGPFGVYLHIRTSSLDQPEVDIPVFGIIAARYEVDPPVVVLRKDGTRTGAQRRLKIQATTTNTELHISNIKSDNPAVQVTVDEAASARYKHLVFLNVNLVGEVPPGTHSATITIPTGAEAIGDVRVPVTIEVP